MENIKLPGGRIHTSEQLLTAVRLLVETGKIPTLRKCGSQFGLSVVTLQKEGEKYTYHSVDSQTHEPRTYEDTVPQGESYVMISSPARQDLGKFWNAVEAEEQSQKQPTSPKT